MKTLPILLVVLLASSPFAQASDNSAIEKAVSAEVTLISDYVYRGMTQTWGKPAVQASLDTTTPPDFMRGYGPLRSATSLLPAATLRPTSRRATAG